MRSITVYSDANKIGRSNLPQLFVNHKIAIRKQGKLNVKGFPEIINFKIRVTDADSDHFHFALECGVVFNAAENIVYSGSLPLTVRSVHAEYFNNNHLGFYLRNFKFAGCLKAEIFPLPDVFRHR